jgi:putative transposase
MRKSRFSQAQTVAILREVDKSPVAEVAKKHDISKQTIYSWRQRFGAMNADEVKRLRPFKRSPSSFYRSAIDRIAAYLSLNIGLNNCCLKEYRLRRCRTLLLPTFEISGINYDKFVIYSHTSLGNDLRYLFA